MNLIVLDFETYYGDDYTLNKMTTEEYIRDSRFEAHGCAVRGQLGYAGAPVQTSWYDEDKFVVHVVETIDWSKTAVLCHHAHFDGLILAHHYGIKPKFWFDTLPMARLLLGNHISVSLDSLAKHFGLAAKTVPYNLFKNKHWSELAPIVQKQVAGGCCHDVELTWQLFQLLAKEFPREEYAIVDQMIRMFTEPVLAADIDLLAKVWEREAQSKAKRIAALNVTATELQSADKFAALLEAEGVEIETKQGKKKSIPCFAKTDDFMRNLLEDENERVRALAEARLGVKSTLMQTRAETLGWMGRRGALPVYLNYAGAGTLRPSGGDGANWLNFKRGSDIRKAILAPDGYLLAPVDSSQIECRVLHYLAGGPEEPVVQKFRKHEDPYVDLASLFYKEAIYKPRAGDPRRAEMEAKRGMGKQGRLMCGYGAAGPKFKTTAKNGLYGPPVDIPLQDAEAFVSLYRATTPSVCAPNSGYWAIANTMLARLADGAELQWGPLTMRNRRLYLPNGCPLIYDSLEWHVPDSDEEHVKDFERRGFWRMRTRHGWKKMWGSKLVQNICEAVARVIVTQAQLRILSLGFRTLNHPYDELLLLLPRDGKERQHLEDCKREMSRPVSWLPGLPLDCEGELGERYSK